MIESLFFGRSQSQEEYSTIFFFHLLFDIIIKLRDNFSLIERRLLDSNCYAASVDQ